MDSLQYNEKRAPIYAPDGFPSWTQLNGLDPGGSEFRARVRELQERLETSVDGYLGPSTIDAIARRDLERKRDDAEEGMCRSGFIVVGPYAVEVGVPTRLYVDDFELAETGSRARKSERDEVAQAIVHYDVTFSAEQTHRVLLDQGYSTHFTIDGDQVGTIWQHHNPATQVCYHAGDSNRMSFGIDLNNPALPKWQQEDADRRGRTRPIAKQIVHGVTVERLQYHDEQIDSLNALLDVALPAFEVPRKCPRDKTGQPVHDLIDDPQSFEGVIGHYHEDPDKTDPAPLNWNAVCPR